MCGKVTWLLYFAVIHRHGAQCNIHRYSGYHSGKCYDHGMLVRDIPVVDVPLVEEKAAGVPRTLVTAYQKTKCHVLTYLLHGAESSMSS